MTPEAASANEVAGGVGEEAVRVVGIGASAGGVGALGEFFGAIPPDPGLAFAVVMHLSPEHDSQLAEVLQKSARIPVEQVHGRTQLEPNHVYVIPPNRSLSLVDGHLDVAEFEEPRGRRSPIDTFFRTIADVHPDGIGVLLSGSGTDGVVGLKAIKERGGFILAQSPDEAEYDTMPRSAIATGLVDFVLPVAALAEKILDLRAGGESWRPPDPDGLAAGDAEALRLILSDLLERTGREFRGYKRSTVLRRIGRRMQVHGVRTLPEFLDVLRSSPGEPQALVKDMLISVTSFFRDPKAFEALEHSVVPALFDGGGSTDVIRVWVPGCATGEEAYSVAILLAEAAERKSSDVAIEMFASDLDADALAHAREGLYPDAIAADVGEERLQRFFRREGAYYRVRKELRELILFAEHDLLRDPPFSNLQLLTCRNLLIYLENGLQERVAEVFRYALKPGGFLFLGSSESAPDDGGLRPVDQQHRIYRRMPGDADAPELLPMLPLIPGPRRSASGGRIRPLTPQQEAADVVMHRQALEEHAPPSVLVDRDHSLVHVSPHARRYLLFPAGSPSANLLKAVHRELKVELRSVLFHALEKDEAARSGWIPVVLDGERREVQIHAAPAPVAEEVPMALVTFLEVPGSAGPDADGPATETQRLDVAEAEMDNLRARLHEMVESAESREAELRAANEELQSMNEEYKSTLEELQTSREELQSANEELRTVNEELNRRVDELATANDDLRNLMAATDVPTLFLDRSLRVQRFTPALQGVFNIMPVDEGRPIAHLTHRLDYPDLAADCQGVLDTLQPVEREADDDDRDAWLVRITPYRTDDDRIGGVVATFTDVSRVREAQRHTEESEERFRALVDATAEIVWTTNPEGDVVGDSPSWRMFTGQTEQERRGSGWLEAVHPDDRARAASEWMEAVAETRVLDTEFRLWNEGADAWRITAVRAVPVLLPDGSIREWVGMNTDITERRAAERALQAAKAAAEQAAETKSQFLATMSHELRTPLTAVIGMADLLETEVIGPMNDRQKKHLNRVKSAAWHLVTIVEEVLSYSRAEAGRTEVHRTTVDLAAVAREVVEVLEVEAEAKGLEIELEGADHPEFLFSDSGKIRQIATNLLGNAVKFTTSGRVMVRVEASESVLRLVVRDTGPGVSADQIDRIFEPFTQGDSSSTREKGGVGLGLAVARRLARLLGGDIEMDTEAGEGSTFTLRLPREPEEPIAR